MQKDKFPLEMSARERQQRLLDMPDEEIDYSDIPELDDDFFQNAKPNPYAKVAKNTIMQPQKNNWRIVIASPGDVQEERKLLKNTLIPELDRNLARDKNYRIDAYLWEDEIYPQLHPKGPQGAIDDKFKIPECDLLICIFWKRFGTPTEDGKTGTEHEFITAFNAWKNGDKTSPQIMLYFKQQPFTPQSSKESKQWTKVLEFRENLPEECLYWKYDDTRDFERKARQHLNDFFRGRIG